MDYSLAPNDVLDFQDFLYPFFEDRNVTSTTFRSKYQMFMDQLLKVAFQCISENSTHYLNTQQLLKPDSFFNTEILLHPSPILYLQSMFAKHDRTDGLPGNEKTFQIFRIQFIVQTK